MAKSKQAAVKQQDSVEALSFEGALEQLESTVGRLEEGEMPLEESLELFEKGVALSRRCTETLEAAEKRIEVLVAESAENEDDWATEAFEHEDEEDELDD